MNRKPATNLHVRHITTEFSSKHSQLPVDRWETATEHETFPSGTFTNIRTVGYARDYHLIDPRLYIREFPVASAFAGALLATLTVTTVLVIMSAPHRVVRRRSCALHPPLDGDVLNGRCRV